MNVQQQLREIGAQRDAGAHAQALAALRPLLAAFPQELAVQRMAAELHEHLGDYAAATTHFQQMLAIRPQAIAALTGLGRMARHRKAWSDMLTWFERAHDADPHHVGSYGQRADALIKLQRQAEAERVLSAGLALHPDNTELHKRLLQLLFARDAHVQAETLTALLLHHHSSDEFLWRQHLRALRAQNKRQELLQQSERALLALPQSVALRAEHVRILLMFGRHEAAQDCARQLRAHLASDANALQAWGQLQLALGHVQRVLVTLDDLVVATSPAMQTATLLLRAKAELAQGNDAVALQHLQRLLTEQPDHQEGKSLLAEVLLFRFDADALVARRDHGWLVNQFRNEARLFPAAFAAMARAAAHAPTHRELALAGAAVVRDTPQCSNTTLCWLRRLGHAAELFRADAAEEIPRHVVQYWHGPLPQDVADSMARWQNHHSIMAYRMFDAEQAHARLHPHAPALSLAAFQQLDPRVQADLARWAILYEDGGLWINADCVRRHGLPDHLLRGRTLVLVQNPLGYFDPGVVAAAPGHPLLRRTLDFALEAALAQPELPHVLTSGHAALAMACATQWGDELVHSGHIHGGALLPQSVVRQFVSLSVPHDYHRLAHIPAAILERLTSPAA